MKHIISTIIIYLSLSIAALAIAVKASAQDKHLPCPRGQYFNGQSCEVDHTCKNVDCYRYGNCDNVDQDTFARCITPYELWEIEEAMENAVWLGVIIQRLYPHSNYKAMYPIVYDAINMSFDTIRFKTWGVP